MTVSQPRSQPGVDLSICTTPSIGISPTLEPSRLQGIHTRAWVAAETTREAAHRAHGSANRNTVGAPAISLTQNGDGFPDITATYCFPPSSYVTTPPPIPPPVLNRYSTFPSRASKVRKSPELGVVYRFNTGGGI